MGVRSCRKRRFLGRNKWDTGSGFLVCLHSTVRHEALHRKDVRLVIGGNLVDMVYDQEVNGNPS